MLPVDPATYAIYLGVMAVMAVTPGPANLFAIASGARHGARTALVCVAGMNAATLVWYAAAALGLAGLVKAFPQYFHVLAIAGALYVAWLGLNAIREGWTGAHARHQTRAPRGPAAAFADGFAVQFANPKIVLFFGAVLPPFLDPARPVLPQLALFAAATIVLDAIAMSAYGVAGGALAARMQAPRFRRAFKTTVGILLIGAAALILLRQ